MPPAAAAAAPTPAPAPSAAAARPAPSPVVSGLKLLSSGMLLRQLSPNLFGVETPLLVGTPGNAAMVVGVLAVILLTLLDFFAGPRCRPRFMHRSAVDWLNQAKAFEMNGRISSRAYVVFGCLVRAAGEEALFRYALPTLVPPLGVLNAILRLPYPMPMGHLISGVELIAYSFT